MSERVFSALILALADELAGKILELDDSLPIEREYEKEYTYIGNEPLKDMFLTAYMAPEKFELKEVPKPLPELDELRSFVDKMVNLANHISLEQK